MDVVTTALQMTRAIPVPETAWTRRHLAPGAFEAALEAAATASAASSAPSVHTVQAGESLWSICRAHLNRLSGSPGPSAVSEAVRQVARHNRISDADFIVPGQQIDLSVLGQTRSARGLNGEPREAAKAAPVPHATSLGGPSPVANPRAEAVWRTKKAALQAKGAFVGFLKDTSAPAGSPASETEKSFGGLLGGPAWLSSKFGMRKDPFTGRVQRHNGIDIAAPKGTGVYALREGRVTYSGWRGDYGRLVVVRHEDGTETRYGHLSERLVKEGDTVDSDTVIGKVGSSGRSTGPHLHFEVRENSRPVDPFPHVQAPSVPSVNVAQVF